MTCMHLELVAILDSNNRIMLGQWLCMDCRMKQYHCKKCNKAYDDNQQDRDWHQWNCTGHLL